MVPASTLFDKDFSPDKLSPFRDSPLYFAKGELIFDVSHRNAPKGVVVLRIGEPVADSRQGNTSDFERLRPNTTRKAGYSKHLAAIGEVICHSAKALKDRLHGEAEVERDPFQSTRPIR